ncbi:MAG: hypothetical protein HY600_02840 [Candidatus Omnitrophica bacterium]|nr:hypothetical protein [Candidatus Omnitrophota bacterium]
MTDAHPRETSLFLGMGIVVALVAAIFFSMTMAWRQAAQRHARWRELRQQVVAADRQTREAPPPEARDQLAAQAQQAGRVFVTSDQIPLIRSRVAALAEQAGVTVTWLPTTTPVKPAAPWPGFDGCYEVLSLVGTLEAPYRGVAEVLDRLAAFDDPAIGVRSCAITPAPPSETPAVDPRQRLKARFVLETYLWTPGASPKGGVPPPPAGPAPLARDSSDTPAAWARDPFDPRYVPTGGVEGLTLNGIVWDSRHPTCLINGTELGPGDMVNGYTALVITPETVVLRGESREAVLTVSP